MPLDSSGTELLSTSVNQKLISENDVVYRARRTMNRSIDKRSICLCFRVAQNIVLLSIPGIVKLSRRIKLCSFAFISTHAAAAFRILTC